MLSPCVAQQVDSIYFDQLADSIKKYHPLDIFTALKYAKQYHQLTEEFPNVSRSDEQKNLARLGYIYQGIAWPLINEDVEATHQYLDSAQQVFLPLQDKGGQVVVSYTRGVVYRRSGSFKEAIDAFTEFKDYYASKQDTFQIANVLYQIGASYAGMGDLIKSRESYLESMKLYEAIGDRRSYITPLYTLAIDHKKMGQYDQAKTYYLEALEVAEELNQDEDVINLYINLGALEAARKKSEAAFGYYRHAKALAERMGTREGKGFVYENLGEAFLVNGQLDSSSYYFEKCLQERELLKNDLQWFIIQNKLGVNYTNLGQRTKGINALQQAYDGVVKLDAVREQQQFSADLAQAYAEDGRFENAWKYSKISTSLKDSLINAQIVEATTEMSAKYEAEKKDKAILALQYEDQLKESRITNQRMALAGTGVALALLGFLFFRVRAKNQKIEQQNEVITKALAEKELLLREIHHRVKNNLQVISSLLGIQSMSIRDEKAKEAILEGRARVHTMSLIHQNLYQKDNLASIEMSDYLPKLCMSLFNTYNISGNRIDLKTDIAPMKLDVETVIPIGLIVNELITNALKYAFPDAKTGEISVHFEERKNSLLVSVADNGIGLSKEVSKEKQDSFGYKLIDAFKAKLNADIEINNEEGTCVQLFIKEYKKVA